MADSIEFRVTADDFPRVVPVVNGESLLDLVAAFETQRHLPLPGRYGGLIPAYFRFGDLTRYYLGREVRQWPQAGQAWLLGCECGEVGCWPLEANIDVTDDLVVWRNFRNGQVPSRDYRAFGPFVFTRSEYDHAVQVAVAELEARSVDDA